MHVPGRHVGQGFEVIRRESTDRSRCSQDGPVIATGEYHRHSRRDHGIGSQKLGVDTGTRQAVAHQAPCCVVSDNPADPHPESETGRSDGRDRGRTAGDQVRPLYQGLDLAVSRLEVSAGHDEIRVHVSDDEEVEVGHLRYQSAGILDDTKPGSAHGRACSFTIFERTARA